MSKKLKGGGENDPTGGNSGVQTNCYNSSKGIYDPNTGEWIIGDMEVGETQTLVIKACPLQSGLNFNLTDVSGNELEINPRNNYKLITLNVQNTADLDLEMSCQDTIVAPGTLVEFDLSIINKGPDTAFDVIYQDSHAGLTFVSAEILQDYDMCYGVCGISGYNGEYGKLSIIRLEDGNQINLRIIIRCDIGGLFPFKAIVSSATADQDLTNNHKEIDIRVGLPPVASFEYVVNNLEVDLINTTQNDPNFLTEYEWEFGTYMDQGYSTDTNPHKTFPTQGTYFVQLRASNIFGTTFSSQSVFVHNPPGLPIAPGIGAWVMNQYGMWAEVYVWGNIDNNNIWPPINAIHWNFGDGGTADGIEGFSRFYETGGYLITCTITNDIGSVTGTYNLSVGW
jgi:PKD repeat protein